MGADLLFRIVRIEEDFVDQISYPSEKRLARILLLPAHPGKQSISKSAVLKVSLQTLAEMGGRRPIRYRPTFWLLRFYRSRKSGERTGPPHNLLKV
jgi:hypothetical protein